MRDFSRKSCFLYKLVILKNTICYIKRQHRVSYESSRDSNECNQNRYFPPLTMLLKDEENDLNGSTTSIHYTMRCANFVSAIARHSLIIKITSFGEKEKQTPVKLARYNRAFSPSFSISRSDLVNFSNDGTTDIHSRFFLRYLRPIRFDFGINTFRAFLTVQLLTATEIGYADDSKLSVILEISRDRCEILYDDDDEQLAREFSDNYRISGDAVWWPNSSPYTHTHIHVCFSFAAGQK